MDKVLMIGADVHVKTILAKYVVDRGEVKTRSFGNCRRSWERMTECFRSEAEREGAGRIVFVYEASGLGFELHDYLVSAGISCFLLAPTKMKRSERDRRRKTDETDAQLLLEALRGHVLAGNALPTVTVPDRELRDDRRLVRTRLDTAQKASKIKTQIQGLLKDVGVEKPSGLGDAWSKAHRAWLAGLCAPGASVGSGAQASLSSLLRQLAFYEGEIGLLDGAVKAVAKKPRYRKAVRALDKLIGVRVLTALVFLTEMGDVLRFCNRREVGAFMGLVPRSSESGAASDRKGAITRQGSARLRRVLCQAAWARVRHDPEAKTTYDRIVRRNPKKKMIAVVACMRKLGIKMWHEAVRAITAA